MNCGLRSIDNLQFDSIFKFMIPDFSTAKNVNVEFLDQVYTANCSADLRRKYTCILYKVDYYFDWCEVFSMGNVFIIPMFPEHALIRRLGQ